jgi:RNA polymerase sigma factor (sigma-70 family)
LSIQVNYTEQDLILKLKERNNQAYNYLYDSYSAALYSIILQILRETELANDVLQDVFINIWRKIESYDPAKGRLFTWMLNIARNASIDVLRSKDYQNNRKNQDLTENVHTKISGLIHLPDIDNIGLVKILEKLKVEYRILIELAYFKGYTHEEIAEIEDIPLGTVKTRIRNALLQLREFLQ